MMKKLVLILLFLSSLTASAQQEKGWQWITGGGSVNSLNREKEKAYDIATDSDQNIYFVSKVGKTSISIDGTSIPNDDPSFFAPDDMILVSLDCNGGYRWSKIIGGFSYEKGVFLEVGTNDQIYLVGRFGSCDGDETQPHIGQDTIVEQSSNECQILFMANFSQEGELNWLELPQQALDTGLTGPGGSSSRDLLMDDNDNLYWLVSLTPSTLDYPDATSTEKSFYILKYDPQGNFQEVLDPNFDLGIYWGGNLRFYRNPYNGHFYFTSRSTVPEDSAIVDGNTIENAFFLAHYDAQMNLQWITEDNTEDDAPNIFNLQFDSDNNIYLAGRFAGLGIGDFLGFQVDESNYFPTFLMKIDPTGQNRLWTTYNNQNLYNQGDFLIKNDTIILVSTGNNNTLTEEGYTWGDENINIPILDGEGIYEDPIIAYFDMQTGDILHLDYLKSKNGSTVEAITLDAAGDVLMGGSFENILYDSAGNETYSNSGVQTDFFVTKYATAACNEPLASTPVVQKTQWKAYPNPTSEQVTIELQQKASYKLYNLQGRLMKEGQLSPGNPSIGLSGFQSGVYFLRLSGDNGKVETVKIVKE
jgi:hypothetical protein